MSNVTEFAAKVRGADPEIRKDLLQEVYQLVAARNCPPQLYVTSQIENWRGGTPIEEISRTTSKAKQYTERLAAQGSFPSTWKDRPTIKIRSSSEAISQHEDSGSVSRHGKHPTITLAVDPNEHGLNNPDVLKLLAEYGIQIHEITETERVEVGFSNLLSSSFRLNLTSIAGEVFPRPYTEHWDVLGHAGNEVILRRKLPNGVNEEFVIATNELESKGLKNLRAGRRIQVSKDPHTGKIKFELQRYTRLESTPLLKSILQKEKEEQLGT